MRLRSTTSSPTRCPRPASPRCARAWTSAIWQLAAFSDNLFDSHTVTNYALGQTDGNCTPQQNDYTFRPRTIGITPPGTATDTRAASRQMIP